MRRCFSISLILAVILFIGVGQSHAFKNEPPGFRGMQWGSSAEGIEDLYVYNDAGDFVEYRKKKDNLVFGDAIVESITYCFYKDRFFRVLISYKNMWNYDALKDRLFYVYGPGQERKDDYKTWWWFGRHMSVGLTYGIFHRGGTLSFIYSPIQIEREKDHVTSAKDGSIEF